MSLKEPLKSLLHGAVTKFIGIKVTVIFIKKMSLKILQIDRILEGTLMQI